MTTSVKSALQGTMSEEEFAILMSDEHINESEESIFEEEDGDEEDEE
jgi:hypothetical protein